MVEGLGSSVKTVPRSSEQDGKIIPKANLWRFLGKLAHPVIVARFLRWLLLTLARTLICSLNLAAESAVLQRAEMLFRSFSFAFSSPCCKLSQPFLFIWKASSSKALWKSLISSPPSDRFWSHLKDILSNTITLHKSDPDRAQAKCDF